MLLLSEIEREILFFIQNHLHNEILDKVMIFITFLGDRGFVWILLSLILILNKKYRYIGILTLISLMLCTIIGEGIIKNIIGRPRPFTDYPSINLLIKPLKSFSFPSGHTASSFAAAGVLIKYFKKYRIIIIVFACVMAFSRLYLFVHYPGDILAGIVLGLLCSKIVIIVYARQGVKNG